MRSKGRMPRFPLPFRHSLTAVLGLAAVITGILGMHILNGALHGPGPGARTASVTSSAMPHQHAGPDEAIATAGLQAAAAPAGCAGPCGGDHHMAAAGCILMVVTAGFSVLFLPGRLLPAGRHGRRGPPYTFAPAPPVRRPPSLVQLSISRT